MLTELEASIESQSQSREERVISSRHSPTKDLASEQEEIPVPKLIPESDKDAPRHQTTLKSAIVHSSAGISEKSPTRFDTQTNFSPRRGAVILGLGSMTLVFLLLAQFLYFNKNQLSKQPLLASFMENTCNVIGCAMDPIRDIDRIEIISRNVFSHPSLANALMITATFANVASFPQPYPVIQVSLTNLQGKTVAARLFSPHEYLPNAKESSALMKPGVPVEVSVEVLDPQNGAMAFEFAFFDRLG